MMKKGITIVFTANILNMIFSIATSFILPKYLSIETYGYIKIFQLYINYLGIAHLGYVDGIYLKYGGKRIRDMDAAEIIRNSATLRNMQIMLSAAALIVSLITGNTIAILLALSCVPINMISFYKNLYQATGEFENYGRIITILPMLTFAWDIALLFICKCDDYVLYILVLFFCNTVVYLFLEYKNLKIFGKGKCFVFDLKLLKDNITSGVTLTIGNFASIMITSIDRWCIQAWMAISEFSFYSFAVSVENLFNVCVSAVTTTLYNYLCKVDYVNRIIKLKSYCVFGGIYLVAIAFPVKFIINRWLAKYNDSVNCLFILICAHLFYFIIKAIYVNFYKAKGWQKHYLCQMAVVLAITIATNITSFYLISRTKEAIASASLSTAIIWYFICHMEIKEIRGRIQEQVLMIVCSVLFLTFGISVGNTIYGLLGYLLSVTIISLILCPQVYLEFVHICIEYGNSLLKRSIN